MKYYLATENNPLGPFSLEQLKLRGVAPDVMVWCDGMADWQRADSLPELAEAIITDAGAMTDVAEIPLQQGVTPPSFDRARYNNVRLGIRPMPAHVDMTGCPSTHRLLAILAFAGIIPCAIVAIIFSSMATRLWEEGKQEEARRKSRQTLVWSLLGLVIGLPLNIYVMFFSDQAMYNEMIEDLLKTL